MVRLRNVLRLLRPRVGARALAASLCALFLLCVAAATAFAVLALRHVLSTPHEQSFPVFFAADRGVHGLSANVSLNPERLRFASSLRAQLRLVLPDSDVNLASSVFAVSVRLQLLRRIPAPASSSAPSAAAADGDAAATTARDEEEKEEERATDVATGGAQAVMRFRSGAHRAVRALVLAPALLAGLADENQRLRLDVLRHDLCAAGCAAVPANNVHIALHAPVQVARAELVLYITRRAFLASLLRDYATAFLLITVVLWYTMLAAVALLFWTGYKLRAAARSLWGSAWTVRVATAPPAPKAVASTSGCVKRKDVCETHWCSEDMVSGDLPPLYKSFSYQRSSSRVSENGVVGAGRRRSGLRRRVSMESSTFTAASSGLAPGKE